MSKKEEKTLVSEEKHEFWETYDFEKKPIIKIGVTHSGMFHADDVFSTALLKLLYPNIQILRMGEVPYNIIVNKNTIVYDIGNHKYDHHGTVKDVRSNGIPRASFGKLWKDFGKFLIEDKTAQSFIEFALVQEIDRTDCGLGSNLLSTSFKWMNKSWEEDDNAELEYFNQAVSFAEYILKKIINRKQSEINADEAIKHELYFQRGSNILVLNKYMPVSQSVREDVLYYIYPATRGGYNIAPILNKYTNTWRRKLPIDRWTAHPPTGFRFYHEKFCNFDTIENAVIAAQTELITEDDEVDIVSLVKNSNWIVKDSETHENTHISSMVILNNGICCPIYINSNFYTLNQIICGEDKLPCINYDKSFGTMICIMAGDSVQAMRENALKFNSISNTYKISRIIRSDGKSIELPSYTDDSDMV